MKQLYNFPPAGGKEILFIDVDFFLRFSIFCQGIGGRDFHFIQRIFHWPFLKMTQYPKVDIEWD